MKTFYWHDYETWGINPRTDRAAQFAGMRTDENFNPIGKPLVIYSKPADDFLPEPAACMVTGLSPQLVTKEGMPEADFFKAIHKELAEPGTCTLGYNSIRFDDEFSRYGFYRNFIDPYAREWQNSNSRWDLIDLVRLMHALRPEGINWPKNEDGTTSFRLERLTAENGIAHEGAHDALSDVQATIELAKLVKEKQPRLFDYTFNNRDKNKLAALLDVSKMRPVVHISSRYPARLGCIAVVIPIAKDRRNKNGIIVYDLREDPSDMLSMSVEEIKRLVFTSADDLKENEKRIPLKMIHLNKSPIIAPLNTLNHEVREKWNLNNEENEAVYRNAIYANTDLSAKLEEVFSSSDFEKSIDPDQTLYDGFISSNDRKIAASILATEPQELHLLTPQFNDKKFQELLFRYRARNWPELLSVEDKNKWDLYRKNRILEQETGISLSQYRKELALYSIDLSLTDKKRKLVNELLDWPEAIKLD